MAIKRFGRLAGSTAAMAAQADTTPANAPTPYETVEPATKLFAYGEGVTSQALNRAIGAVAANVEDLLVLMDMPATKAEILEPAITGAGPFYGFTCLADVDPSVGIDLGVNLAGELTPVVWMHVGMHASQLGQFVQLAHEPSDSTAARSVILRPTDVQASTAALSYFPGGAYPLSPEHSNPDMVPPIAPITTALPPYGTLAQTVLVADWDTDGCRLAGPTTWSSLHMRPGCYVHILSGDQQGLYMIAAISNNRETPADDKATLVHGLHRVTLDVGHTLTAGERVSWSRRVGAAPLAELTNSAYVMFVDGEDVYLSTFTGSDDVTDSATPAKASTGIAGPSFNTGSLGYQEDEVAGNPSGLLQANTALVGALAGAGVVEAHIPAGSPVRFVPGAVVGQSATMCSPPGFLLNPYLILPAGQGGRYRGYCRSLTTVRERLRSGALTSTRGSWFDDGAWQQFTPLYQHALETFTQSVRRGYQPVVPLGQTPAWDALSIPAQVLGEGLWRVVVSGASTMEADGALPGMTLALTNTAVGGGAVTYARIAHVDGNVLWLHGVSTAAWGDGLDRTREPIEVTNSTFTFGVPRTVTAIQSSPRLSGNNQTLAALTTGTCTVAAGGVSLVGGWGSLWATELRVGDQVLVGSRYGIVASITDNTHLTLGNPVEVGAAAIALAGVPFIPGDGLNAAYHAHYSGDPLTRGNGGAGRHIQLAVSKPVVLQSTAASFPALAMVDSAGTTVGGLDINGSVLQLKDGNAAAVDLSSATDTAIDPALPQNILGALNSNGSVLGYGFANAPMMGCTTTGVGTAVATVAVDGADPLTPGATANLVWYDGRLQILPNPITVATPASNGWFYLITDGLALTWQDTPPTAGQVALAHVEITGGAPWNINAIVNTRVFIRGVNHQVDIHVGGPDAHFPTLGAAMACVNALGTPGSGVPARKYRILVRGPTTETAPIDISTHGLIIEGVPGVQTADGAGAVISWDGDQVLFRFVPVAPTVDIRDVTFRDLSLNYLASVAADATLSRAAFFSNFNVTRLTIENVSIRAANPTRLHGYLWFTGGVLNDARVVGCDWGGASEFGVDVAFSNRLHIHDSIIWSDNTTQRGAALGSSGGIVLGVGGYSEDSTLRGLYLYNWGNRGVVIGGASVDVRVDTCTVEGGDTNMVPAVYALYAAGVSEPYLGFEVSATVVGAWIVNCITKGLGAINATHAWGVWIAGDRVFLRDNRLNLNAAPANKLGYELTANSQYCIVDGNQTEGWGSAVAGGPHSIGAMNRDDV